MTLTSSPRRLASGFMVTTREPGILQYSYAPRAQESRERGVFCGLKIQAFHGKLLPIGRGIELSMRIIIVMHKDAYARLHKYAASKLGTGLVSIHHPIITPHQQASNQSSRSISFRIVEKPCAVGSLQIPFFTLALTSGAELGYSMWKTGFPPAMKGWKTSHS